MSINILDIGGHRVSFSMERIEQDYGRVTEIRITIRDDSMIPPKEYKTLSHITTSMLGAGADMLEESIKHDLITSVLGYVSDRIKNVADSFSRAIVEGHIDAGRALVRFMEELSNLTGDKEGIFGKFSAVLTGGGYGSASVAGGPKSIGIEGKREKFLRMHGKHIMPVPDWKIDWGENIGSTLKCTAKAVLPISIKDEKEYEHKVIITKDEVKIK